MARYRFLLTPRWILLTVAVAAAVVLMIRLGLWQLDRLHGRRDANAAIAQRWSDQPRPADAVLPAGSSPAAVSDAVWRPVTVTGEYRPADQVLVRNRSLNEVAGFWVVTPLVDTTGRAWVVNRGWVPVAVGEGPATNFAPPAGTVTVSGMLRETERHDSALGPTDPADGRLAVLSRLDLDRLGSQLPYPVSPVWVQLERQEPAQGTFPMAVPKPELDDGPHLNYTGQWFIYAALTMIVFPLAVRRAARAREAKAAAAAAEAAAGGPTAGGPDPGEGGDPTPLEPGPPAEPVGPRP